MIINEGQLRLVVNWVELQTLFFLAWSSISFQRFSGFFSFWKYCCSSFLVCKHPVKVRTFSKMCQQDKNPFPFVQEKMNSNIWIIERQSTLRYFFAFSSILQCFMYHMGKRISSGTSDSTFSTDSWRPSMSCSCIAYWGK